jgi:hypothetical protein
MLQRLPPLVARAERLTLDLEARLARDEDRRDRGRRGWDWVLALLVGLALGLALR